jgi:hypothetical protein
MLEGEVGLWQGKGELVLPQKGLVEGLPGHKASQVGQKTSWGHMGQSLGVADIGRHKG